MAFPDRVFLPAGSGAASPLPLLPSALYNMRFACYPFQQKGRGSRMAQKRKTGTLSTLFFSMLSISAFTFGGGFVIVTFMKRKFVDELHWLSESEMLDMTALAQSAPGAIAVNAAILVGWRAAGFAGMLMAVLGTILPPMLILSVISFFYASFAANPWVAGVLRGMQAGVAAVILDVVCDLGGDVLAGRSPVHIAVMVCAFLAAWVFGMSVVYIILAAAGVGIALAMIQSIRKRGKGNPA